MVRPNVVRKDFGPGFQFSLLYCLVLVVPPSLGTVTKW